MPLSTTHTLDGVEVVPDLLVWDYDLRPCRVTGVAFHDRSIPWFATQHLDGTRGKDFDASRLWFRHPSTGKQVQA